MNKATIPEKIVPPLQGTDNLNMDDVIAELVTTRELFDIRQMLWDFYKAAVKDDATYDTWQERSNLVLLYEHLDALVIVAYKKHKEMEEKRKRHKEFNDV